MCVLGWPIGQSAMPHFGRNTPEFRHIARHNLSEGLGEMSGMKPITDDVVFSIMQGLEQRERNQRAAMDAARAALPRKVLGPIGNRRIISLDHARQRARRTVSGMFCYVARNG